MGPSLTSRTAAKTLSVIPAAPVSTSSTPSLPACIAILAPAPVIIHTLRCTFIAWTPAFSWASIVTGFAVCPSHSQFQLIAVQHILQDEPGFQLQRTQLSLKGYLFVVAFNGVIVP